MSILALIVVGIGSFVYNRSFISFDVDPTATIVLYKFDSNEEPVFLGDERSELVERGEYFYEITLGDQTTIGSFISKGFFRTTTIKADLAPLKNFQKSSLRAQGCSALDNGGVISYGCFNGLGRVTFSNNGFSEKFYFDNTVSSRYAGITTDGRVALIAELTNQSSRYHLLAKSSRIADRREKSSLFSSSEPFTEVIDAKSGNLAGVVDTQNKLHLLDQGKIIEKLSLPSEVSQCGFAQYFKTESSVLVYCGNAAEGEFDQFEIDNAAVAITSSQTTQHIYEYSLSSAQQINHIELAADLFVRVAKASSNGSKVALLSHDDSGNEQILVMPMNGDLQKVFKSQPERIIADAYWQNDTTLLLASGGDLFSIDTSLEQLQAQKLFNSGLNLEVQSTNMSKDTVVFSARNALSGNVLENYVLLSSPGNLNPPELSLPYSSLDATTGELRITVSGRTIYATFSSSADYDERNNPDYKPTSNFSDTKKITADYLTSLGIDFSEYKIQPFPDTTPESSNIKLGDNKF